METNINLINWVIAWVVILAIIMLRNTRDNIASVGLVIIFALNLTKEHLSGAFIYILPWYHGDIGYFTALGFVESTKALASFAVGSLILAPFIAKAFHCFLIKEPPHIPDLKMPLVYIVVGFLFYFSFGSFLERIPSFRTFVYCGWNLMVAGLCLIIWKNWCIRNRKMMIFWLLLSGVLPAFTMVGIGFLGYGITALIAIFVFVGRFYRPRRHVFFAGIILCYLGLSLYVNYMQARSELREKISADTVESGRMEVVSDMFSKFEFFSLTNHKHLELIDTRLNLNYLVGAAVDYMQSENQEFAKGETIKNAILAAVPRIIWPDKPMRLGGSAMVTRYTGIVFAEGTTVAPGLVMEFYINFGTISVIIGFMALGIVITFIDKAAALCLESGNWYKFIFWFLVGITFLPTEYLTHISMTAASTIVFAIFINTYILPVFTGQKKVKR